MLGNTRANIMASENLITASKVMAAPKTVNIKYMILYERSIALLLPKRYFQACNP